jgi:hypothetical protein
MNLYFQNSRDERRIIGNPENEDQAFKMIQSFLKEKNYKSYYTRTWKDDEGTWYDVGSHSEFFLLGKE